MSETAHDFPQISAFDGFTGACICCPNSKAAPRALPMEQVDAAPEGTLQPALTTVFSTDPCVPG